MTITELPPTIVGAAPMQSLSGGQNLLAVHLGHATHHRVGDEQPNLTSGHVMRDAQEPPAAGDQATPDAIRVPNPSGGVRPGRDFPPTKVDAIPTVAASAGQTSESGQLPSDTQGGLAALGSISPDGQGLDDTHSEVAVGVSTSTLDHSRTDTHTPSVGRGPILASPLLGMAAEVVDDLERVRIANESRYRTLTATGEYGFGLTDAHPDIARLRALVDSLDAAEHQAILNLQRTMRQHPLGPWVKAAPGVGEKQAARLLAAIRDPYWNDLHERPRTVSELWTYCGFHVIKSSGSHRNADTQAVGTAGSTCHPSGQPRRDTHTGPAVGVAPKRTRGQKSNWSEDARKRAWLIAASCVKQPAGTRYRDIYDATRAKYADAVHNADCVRCGPAGKPALTGTPLSAGHQHARAMRAIAKAVLKDLWTEAKRIHEEQP